MSHPVQEMRDESVGQWLPLIEYSVRCGVSLSTIRRKIKSQTIQFKLEKGKYLIFYQGSDQTWDGIQDQTATASRQPTSQATPNHHQQERSLSEALETIQFQKERISQLEQEKEELAFLVKALEQKYGIRY